MSCVVVFNEFFFLLDIVCRFVVSFIWYFGSMEFMILSFLMCVRLFCVFFGLNLF